MKKLILAIFFWMPSLVWSCPEISGSFENEIAKFKISGEMIDGVQVFHIFSKSYGLNFNFTVIPDGEYREIPLRSGISKVSVAARCKEATALEVSISDKTLKNFRVLTFIKESGGFVRFIERHIEFLNDWNLEKVNE